MDAVDVFEEWNTYAKKKALLPREADLDAIIRNSNVKIMAITGIRRAGKSSVLMLIAQKLEKAGERVCYINLEDSRIKDNRQVLDEAVKWFGDEGFMLLDEITSAHDWEGWLARTHEMLKGKLHVIASSSRKNLVRPSKPLRGRMLTNELYPLSFREFLEFKGIKAEKTTAGKGKLEKAFLEYLKYGGFPEVALTENETDKTRILNSYFKDIIGVDIAEASGEDISTVETFGKYALQSPTFSASKCLNFLKSLGHKIGKEKILKLEHYSQAGYLFFFAPIFSYNIKDKSQYPRKSYCGDTGFHYAITGKIDFGRLFENAAFLELKRRAHEQQEICYWKNKEGLETDFVIKQGTTATEAMQVVYEMEDEKTRKREINSLVSCAKELKAEAATILTKNVSETRTVDGIKIKLVPLMDWLLQKEPRPKDWSESLPIESLKELKELMKKQGIE